MLLTLDRDEIGPYYIAYEIDNTDPGYHDMTIEVDDDWWAAYRSVREAFWTMQNHLASKYEDPEDWHPEDEDEDDGPDCD